MADEQRDRTQDPQGIEQQLDAGVAAQDHLGDAPTDLQADNTMRTDPDDTKQAIRETTEKSQRPQDD